MLSFSYKTFFTTHAVIFYQKKRKKHTCCRIVGGPNIQISKVKTPFRRSKWAILATATTNSSAVAFIARVWHVLGLHPLQVSY